LHQSISAPLQWLLSTPEMHTEVWFGATHAACAIPDCASIHSMQTSLPPHGLVAWSAQSTTVSLFPHAAAGSDPSRAAHAYENA
jgi:hypothetical protein